MSSDLTDRLGDLATHIAVASPPHDLWDRGVRRRRLDRALTAGVVAVLVGLVALGGWTRHEPQPIEPADTHGALQLPDRFFDQPSPWTASFDKAPGPLVTVIPAERKTLFRSHDGLVGVTASSGTYGFLDVPGDAALSPSLQNQFALSPDGRRLAFWTTGSPSGAPNTVLEHGSTLTGVATYDTDSGQVRRTAIRTEHGIDPSLLMWGDDDTLLFSYAQIIGGDGSDEAGARLFGGTEVWDQPNGTATRVPNDTLPTFPDNYGARAAGGMLVVPAAGGDTWWVLDPHDPSQRVFCTNRQADVLVPSPGHERVAAVPGRNTTGGPLVVARVPGADTPVGTMTHFRTVAGGEDWIRPLAWIDANHVAALRREVLHRSDGSPYVAGRIDTVDIRTGSSRPLVATWSGPGANNSDTWLASSVLGAPLVHAAAPPSPVSPRLLLGLGTLALIGLVLALVWKAIRVRRA